jgi:hypothetical protein
MTVLDPGAAALVSADHGTRDRSRQYLQKAPSIPCSDKLGFPVDDQHMHSKAKLRATLTHSAHKL